MHFPGRCLRSTSSAPISSILNSNTSSMRIDRGPVSRLRPLSSIRATSEAPPQNDTAFDWERVADCNSVTCAARNRENA